MSVRNVLFGVLCWVWYAMFVFFIGKDPENEKRHPDISRRTKVSNFKYPDSNTHARVVNAHTRDKDARMRLQPVCAHLCTDLHKIKLTR